MINLITQQKIQEQQFSNFLLCCYDPKIYFEADGSQWIRIFHHGNPANNLFESDDTLNSCIYKNNQKWSAMSLCNLCQNEWEVMIIQQKTTTSDEQKFRWIQYANPLTATYDQVSPSNIFKNSNYTNIEDFGGIYLRNHNNTYLACHLVNYPTYWFGAIGAKTLNGNGIPGYNRLVITTGYLDVYLRADNLNINQISKNNVGFMANDFYEI